MDILYDEFYEKNEIWVNWVRATST
jgi:hypothetical protein